MTYTSEQRALLNTIIANPADDAPRLIYADWLDEHGQEERAEFIRVQYELTNNSDCDLMTNGKNCTYKTKADALADLSQACTCIAYAKSVANTTAV